MTVKWTALKLIAERAKETGARGVDVRELEALSAVVEDLVRDGVLTQDRREIRFSHEALFDQVIARSWAESDLPLVSVLLATDQDLSHRSLVRQVLTYQRGTDHAAYERSISGILGSPDIRYHLKDVALSVLASDQAPSQALWELVSADPVVEVLTTPAWFAYAETAGAVLRWAVGDQPDLAATMLDAALEWDSDRVAEILTALLPIHAWRDKLRLLIDRGPTGSSPTFCRLVAAALTRGLFDNDDVLEMVCWYATEDPDPEEDSWLSRDKQGAPYDGDPLTAGINSVRGAAAETISALLWPRPERLPFFADTLRRICSDRLGAVRACAAVAVLTVAKHDESFARELLGVLVRDAHYRVLATPYVERCIARFKARPGPRLWFLVRRMSQSRVPGTREAGGRLAAQMALESGSAALLNGTVGRWPESRKGVAQVAAALLESDDLRVRGRCAEWLGQLFHDEDPTVRHAAAEWVHSFTEADPASRTLLAAFLASPAYLDDPWPLLKALDDSDHIGSAVVIDAIRLLMTDEPRPGPRRVTRHAHQGLVSDMAIRAYASADTPSIRTAALDLIDDLLSQRDPHIRRLLTRHEAAPGLS
ncbi:hypothetical protein QLR68_01290 [Micromonospora sp. DH15]|nr:hypothetical protein [Micromonospora sp. DH15]